MTSFFWGFLILFALFIILMLVWSRWRHQVGGGFGPSEFSDGHMTTTPTGYPEEMKGHGKTITPTDNNASHM